MLEFLKHNSGAEIAVKMQKTVFERRTIIRGQTVVELQGLSHIMDTMPRLFDKEGVVN